MLQPAWSYTKTTASSKTLTLRNCRAFSWDALSAGAQRAGAVDDGGCRGDSGTQLLLEQQSTVVDLLVLEASIVSEDYLLSFYSCRAFCWVALSARARAADEVVTEFGCRSDRGSQLHLEQPSAVIGLLVLEVSIVPDDVLLSLCSCRAFDWVALSAGATLHGSMDLQMGAGT